MKKKLLALSMAIVAPLAAMAAGQPERNPGEWRALPVTGFGSNAVHVASPVVGEIASGAQARPAKSARRVGEADKSLFEGRTIYGALISSNLWEGMSITEVPYGVYSFTIGDAAVPGVHISDMIYSFKGAAWGRDKMYGIVPLNVMGIINGSRHIQIDTKNWVETSNVLHDSGEGTYSLMPCSMSYDPTNDTFYAFRYKEDLSGLNWTKVNPATSDYEQIAAYRGSTVVLTLAATPDGQMYYIDTEGDLYTVNKENGRTSLVGNTGVSPAAYDQCMVYDNRSGSFLWAALSNEGSVLYSVDPATAETKRVMKFDHSEQFVAIYITDSEALPGAPAAVGRPQLKYSANGALDGAITFTVPSKTFGGSALSGNLNLNVWLDGENLKGEDVAPGTSVSIPVSLEEGNHYIDITVDNEAGYSPMRYIYQYAGYDTPLAPGNAKMEFRDNVNYVTWTTPERGVNNGYIDYDNLTYDVVRMPDNVKVATGLKETSFNEPTPQALQAYYYRITANNNGHESDCGDTNRVLCGDAFPVPYSQTFEEEATFSDFFKVVDNDGSGSSWRYGYSGEVRLDYIKNDADPFDADDWLILPKVSMNGGVKYRFHMNMKTFTSNYPEDFEILVGTDSDDISSFKLIKREEGFTEIASEFGDYSTDFIIETDGDYNLAIRYCSTHEGRNALMMVRNVGIDKVGDTGAPAQVTEMTVIPDADDLLKAAISFKAPEVNLAGDPISSISSIALIRDGEQIPVHTFKPVTPGQSLEWIDEHVPSVGLHTYTAIAQNEAGEGEYCTVEEFIGIYTAPYSTDFTDKKYAQMLWTSEDNILDNEDGWNGWRWQEDAQGRRFYSMYYYLMQPYDTYIWLYSPKFKLEENTVYTINSNGYFYKPGESSDIEWQIAYGDEPNHEKMTRFGDIRNKTLVGGDNENILVNKDGGRYHIGIGVTGAAQFDYFSGELSGFSLIRRASAFAPYLISDWKIEADSKGELKTNIEFKAPTVNYYNENLDKDENLTIKFYQGKDTAIPSHTTTAKPGEKVSWTDSKALHGFNYYRITCENSHGEGEAWNDTIYVGRDLPGVVENISMQGDADNANVRISWSKPQSGVNGGLVLDDETKYNVYAYNPTTNELTPLAENVDSKSYLVEVGNNADQQMYYYAVSAANSEGEGQAVASSIVLGKPYVLPFAESFANASLSTQVWQAIPMIQGATLAGVDNPAGGAYNGCTGPQDNDGGCAYIYNGYQYEVLAGALLVSPKIRMDRSGYNELSFWAYHYKEPEGYINKGTIVVAVSADDAQSEVLTSFEIGGDEETGWTEHKVNLDAYKDSKYLTVALMGLTPGYQDVIYIDNFKVSKSTSGIDGVGVDTENGESELIFDLNGYRIDGTGVNGGRIIISNGKKVVNTKR